ncbi:MAG: hypothetical protein ACRDRR_21275 [Pseudonocardiaceae bacterium]
MSTPHARAPRVAALFLALVLFLLAGCGQSPQTARDPAPAATRTVVDMTGRSVEIPAEVTRIATSFPALNATLLVLGATDRLVAASPGVGPLFETLVPAYKDVPQPFDATLTKVNEEELIATRPDVVLISPGAQSLLPTFERLGIPVVVFKAFSDPTLLKDGVTLLAEIVGGDAVDRAKQFATYPPTASTPHPPSPRSRSRTS